MADYPNLFDKSDPDCIEHVDKVNFDFVETCDITQLPAPKTGTGLRIIDASTGMTGMVSSSEHPRPMRMV